MFSPQGSERRETHGLVRHLSETYKSSAINQNSPPLVVPIKGLT